MDSLPPVCCRAELVAALEAKAKENTARATQALAELSFEETGGGFGSGCPPAAWANLAGVAMPEYPPAAWGDLAGAMPECPLAAHTSPADVDLLREVNAAPGPEIAPGRELHLGKFALHVSQTVDMETVLYVSMGEAGQYGARVSCADLARRGLAHDGFALYHAAGGLALKRLGHKKELWVVGGKIAPGGAAFASIDWRVLLFTSREAEAAAREAGRPPIE